jgi:hypothetical protein
MGHPKIEDAAAASGTLYHGAALRVSRFAARHYVAECAAAARRFPLLNRYERPAPMAGEAEVKFLDGDFRVIRPGAFVRCAVTGIPIPLEELKYWSVDLQEAYATPEAVLSRHRPDRFPIKRAT